MDQLLNAVLRQATRRREHHIKFQIDLLLARCKSPIERQLGVSFFATDAATLCFTSVVDSIEPPDGNHGLYIAPQLPIRQYRADFGLIFFHGYGMDRLAVECDGHDFHEKTKEQAAHDKARDRAFLEEGWPVMRFTGSEIHRAPMKCADQAVDYLMDRMAAAHRKLSEART